MSRALKHVNTAVTEFVAGNINRFVPAAHTVKTRRPTRFSGENGAPATALAAESLNCYIVNAARTDGKRTHGDE